MRWLGVGQRAPSIGVDLRDRMLYIALVRDRSARIVGLGAQRLPQGAVVGGDIREPAEVTRAAAELMAGVHWTRRPTIAVALPPARLNGAYRLKSAPVTDPDPLGEVASSARLVETAVTTFATLANRVIVDSMPVAVARLCRLSQRQATVLFARGAAGCGSWTMCLEPSALDVETSDVPHASNAPEIGFDLGALAAPSWGGLAVDRPVREAFPEPGEWAVAVGAALGAEGYYPTVDLDGPEAKMQEPTVSPAGWTVERVR